MWSVACRCHARCGDPDDGYAAAAPPARCIPASPGPAPPPPSAGAAYSPVPFPALPSLPVFVQSWFRYRGIAGDRPAPNVAAVAAADDDDAVAGDAADADDNGACDRSRRRPRLRRPPRHHS